MLKIRDWDSVFENNRSREIKRLEWVSVPNRHDGGKYAELMDHPDGASHFGAWILMVQVASRCGITAGERGTLRRGDGSPHTPRSLGLATRCPEKVFTDAIPRLVAIGWLENNEISQLPQQDAAIPQANAAIPHNVTTLGEGIEGNITLPSKKKSAKDEFWEPLCVIFGLEPKTQSDELRLYDQCRDFRLKAGSVEELERRAAIYRVRFPDVAFTPKAVLSNWDVLKDFPGPKSTDRPVPKKAKAL